IEKNVNTRYSFLGTRCSVLVPLCWLNRGLFSPDVPKGSRCFLGLIIWWGIIVSTNIEHLRCS
ncbi:MAG: hypothetical protein KAS58_07525, partial [Calditrichia bacterium]|nr:hypothetical protein [Calditrichia bacterium]